MYEKLLRIYNIMNPDDVKSFYVLDLCDNIIITYLLFLSERNPQTACVKGKHLK